MEVDTLSSGVSSNPSIYIPVISNHVSEQYVTKCFKDKNIGTVVRVDFVLNKEKFRREAFVHFSTWYDSEDANKLKADLFNPETKTQFVYKSKKYWPILPNKNPVMRNSPMRKSTSVYELEEKISNIEKDIEKLTFVTKVHDANIRYILRKSDGSSSSNPTTQIKRQKTNDFDDSNDDASAKILRMHGDGVNEKATLVCTGTMA